MKRKRTHRLRLEPLERREVLSVTFEQRIISDEAVGALSLYAADFDADGDADVLSAGEGIAWYEDTDGDGSFSPPQVITMAAGDSVYTADVDGKRAGGRDTAQTGHRRMGGEMGGQRLGRRPERRRDSSLGAAVGATAARSEQTLGYFARADLRASTVST